MAKIIIGNWKMNPPSLKEAISLATLIKKGKISGKNNIILCPPSAYISDVSKVVSSGKSKIEIGAQDCFYENKGAFTGEVSPSILRSVGVKYVMIGHSERRVMGETNEIINKKVKVLLKSGFNVILCIGESSRDETGEYLRSIEEEIKSGLKGVNKEQAKRLIIAYEPIWAIGKEAVNTCTLKDIKEMTIFIKKVLAEIFSRDIGLKTKIVYGGSIDNKNSAGIISEGGVDGLLVGRFSLEAKKFLEIINSASF